MSITFSPNVVTAEPCEFQLWCCDDCVSPTYASEAQAIAARAALPGFREGAAALPGCPLLQEWGDRFSGIPLVVPAGDDFTERPQVNMSTTMRWQCSPFWATCPTTHPTTSISISSTDRCRRVVFLTCRGKPPRVTFGAESYWHRHSHRLMRAVR